MFLRRHVKNTLVCAAVLFARGSALACAQEPATASDTPAVELISVEKIWDAGPHNAFTDLIRFRDAWFCAFREAQAHVKGDGLLRVITSKDGAAWTSAALLEEDGIDLRDPKLSITPDNRLMMVAGGSVYREGKLLGFQPRVAFSGDGHEWGPTHRILEDRDWLWRVTWQGDTAYGMAYGQPKGDDGLWPLKLFRTRDGLNYELVTTLRLAGHPNETTLRFLPDDTMAALMRREEGDKEGWVGTSVPPYTDWKWNAIGHQLGGPNFIRLPDGSLWAASRSYPGGAKTVLARMTLDTYEPVLTLPSGGDCSYPGLVWHDGLLWMSYYASHESKTSIYLAKIRVESAGER